MNGAGNPSPVPFTMFDALMDTYDGDYLRTDDEWDELRWIRERTAAPKGCRVEIVEGLVTVTPSATVRHHVIADRVHRRLCAATPEDWGVHQWWDIAVPRRLGLYVPDLVVVPENTRDTDDGGLCPAGAAELVVEITSKVTACRDRTVKPAGCATGGVPLFLLIDGLAPGGPTFTLHGAPRKDAYRVLDAGPFGEPIKLPAPFDLVIDTSEFPGA